MTDAHINKQTILKRMKQFASDFYGISQADLLDPIVYLFLEALGEEFYKISGEFENIESRIMDRLSSMLIGSIDTIAKPRHSLLHARSTDTFSEIQVKDEFIYTNKSTLESHSFFPVCNTHIYNGDVSHLIYNGTIYSLDHLQHKTILSRSGKKTSFTDHSLWFGIDLDENINNLQNISFHIDLNGVYDKQNYISQLPYINWKIDNTSIPMRKGLYIIENKLENKTLELFSKFDLSNQLNNLIQKQYENYFFTVDGIFDISNKRSYFPKNLDSNFPINIKENFKKPLIWIELVCPITFSEEIISCIQISINRFPILNKKLVSKNITINKKKPIIPLYTKSNESFLSVSSLIDSTGKRYFDIPTTNLKSNNYGIYALRQGGCERYNIREAHSYLINTAYDLKGEASSFFRNKTELKTELKDIKAEISQIIKTLNKTIDTFKKKYEILNYIFFEQEKNEEIYFFEYWVTTCKHAELISVGSIFKTKDNISINPISLSLCQTLTKESIAPDNEEKYRLYKKALTKNKLLVSEKDIKDFFLEEFEEFISDVKIKKGYFENTKNDFIQTIDIYLKTHKDAENFLSEKDELYFENLLLEKSPVTFKYRFFINR